MKPRQLRFLMASVGLLAIALCTTAWITPPSRVNPVYSRVIVHVGQTEFNVYLPVVVREYP